VPAGLVNDSMAVLAHPQLAGRDRWRQVESPGGPVRAALPPWIGEGPEPRMDAIPALGEHTDAILAELGRSAEDIESLRGSGAVA
jgi:crotonobetainyl-CoA:carnitine CoA-transferase CaiB-like acyl-CoA transferase